MRCSRRLAAVVSAAAALIFAAQSEPRIQGQTRPAEPPKTEIQKAVEEFKALTRELGVRPGAPKRRSGGTRGPRWHGRLYENLRNDFLDAVPHEVRQRGLDVSTLRRNQFGVNVSGPVIIPWLYDGGRRTYFSVSYEGVREKVSRSYLRTVPILPERTGDWSQTVDSAGNPLPIFDPQSTRLNPDYDPSRPVDTDNLQYLRDQFPENRMPATRLDPVVQKALAYYPSPNTNVGPFFRNNFFIHAPEVNTANGMITKLDHTVRERHRLSFGLNYSNGLVGSAEWFPNGANPGPPAREYRSRRASTDWVFTISPRTVNTLTFEAESDTSESGLDDETDYPALLGFRGSPSKVFPAFFYEDYVDMGRSYPASKNVRNAYVWTNGFSARRGPHSARVTAQYVQRQVNSYWPQFPSGLMRFSPGLTSLPGIVNTGHGFASFVLGLADYGKLSMVGSPSYFRQSLARVIVSDSWEVRTGLTLAFSANIERQGSRVEKFDRQSTVALDVLNPSNGRKGALVTANSGYGRAFQPVRFRVHPSASLAWNPRGDTKTVIRASYGRSYAQIPIYFGQWGTQAFNGFPTWLSENVQLDPALTVAGGFPKPPRPVPDVRPDAANDTIADLIDMSVRQPTYQSAGVSMEREFAGGFVVTAGFSYAGGKNLLVGNWAANPNAIPLWALEFRDQLNDETFNRSLRQFPQYKGFEVGGLWPRGRYQRDGGYVRVDRRTSGGLTVSGSYEYAKQWDDYSGPYGTQDFFNRDNEWSLTAGLNPHRFSFTYVYELPLGANKPFFSFSDWRRHLVDGWSLSGASSLSSGEPLALHPMFNNTGGVVTALNVNVVPGVDPHVANPGPDMWFNPAAFDQPADFTVGNASRTHPSLRGPIFQNHDLSLTKRFPLRADRSMEFSAVGLNWLNHANWSDPDTTIGPASSPNVNAGKIIGSRGGRVVQLGLRLTF